MINYLTHLSFSHYYIFWTCCDSWLNWIKCQCLVGWVVIVFCVLKIHTVLTNGSIWYETRNIVQSYMYFLTFSMFHNRDWCYLNLNFVHCLFIDLFFYLCFPLVLKCKTTLNLLFPNNYVEIRLNFYICFSSSKTFLFDIMFLFYY